MARENVLRELFQGIAEARVDAQEQVAHENADLITDRLADSLSTRPEIAPVVSLVAQEATMATIGALVESGELDAHFDTHKVIAALQSRFERMRTIDTGGEV